MADDLSFPSTSIVQQAHNSLLNPTRLRMYSKQLHWTFQQHVAKKEDMALNLAFYEMSCETVTKFFYLVLIGDDMLSNKFTILMDDTVSKSLTLQQLHQILKVSLGGAQGEHYVQSFTMLCNANLHFQ